MDIRDVEFRERVKALIAAYPLQQTNPARQLQCLIEANGDKTDSASFARAAAFCDELT